MKLVDSGRASAGCQAVKPSLANAFPSDYDIENRYQGPIPMADDPITRHFFNGFIRLHILYHAAKERIYGAAIAEELVRHGYRLSAGTLYPTLHLLEELGYLQSSRELAGARWRTYYRATRAGRAVVKEARQKLLELVTEVVEDHDEPFRVIQQKRGQH
jgi:DNA-binding PadR family transcriptional regulator